MMQAGVIVSDYATLMVEILKDNGRPEAGAVYGALDMPWATLVGPGCYRPEQVSEAEAIRRGCQPNLEPPVMVASAATLRSAPPAAMLAHFLLERTMMEAAIVRWPVRQEGAP